MNQAEQITSQIENETPLDYFERLVESGIKIVLTYEDTIKTR